MNPEHITSFVTYYLQNLKERTRRERSGTKWGIDWIAYNIGLARFGKPVRLPFLRHGSEGFPKSKSEAEFGVDISFVSTDGSELTVFVLKDEPLKNSTWITNDFEGDLRRAMAPDLSLPGLEDVRTVTVILAYNKDEQQNGVEAYERLIATAPTKVADTVALKFKRWNLSELVDQTIQHLLSPSILPERFFGQLSYLAAQASDFTHGSDKWELQLIPNWKRFLDDVLNEADGARAPELIPVALIIIRQHSAANPSGETGWIDLIEWAMLALWSKDRRRPDPAVHRVVERFWNDFYVPELRRFYQAHVPALTVEHSIDQLASATSVGVIAAAQVAYWHIARLGILSLAVAGQDTNDDERQERLAEIADWLVMLVNANESVLRPVLDVEHIQLFLMFEMLRNAERTQEMAVIVRALEAKLALRRMTQGEVPFIDGDNSLENVLEQVATRPQQALVNDSSSYFLLTLMEMCCVFESSIRDDLLGRIHRHLILGAADVGEPGDREPLDLISWIAPRDWTDLVLDGVVSGESVIVHRFGESRDVTGAEIFEGLRKAVVQLQKAEAVEIPSTVPLGVLVLAALKHKMPLPGILWRSWAFRTTSS